MFYFARLTNDFRLCTMASFSQYHVNYRSNPSFFLSGSAFVSFRWGTERSSDLMSSSFPKKGRLLSSLLLSCHSKHTPDTPSVCQSLFACSSILGTSVVYQFLHHGFLRRLTDIVHPPKPCHLVFCLQLFRQILRLRHFRRNSLHSVLCLFLCLH